MANELRHKTIGTALTQAEYEAIGGHELESQATGDIIYASSATQLSRLAIVASRLLGVVGGIPSWLAFGTGAGAPAEGNHTTPVMTATVAGHVPTPPNNTTTFLRGDATFAAPVGVDISARVYNTGVQSISNAAYNTLTFNTERWDTDTIHSTISNTGRLTATTAGKYAIAGNAAIATNATGIRAMQILLNGTTVIAKNVVTATGGSNATYFAIATQYNLAAADYVELQVYQDSGGALDTVVEANDAPEFMMQKGPG